MKRVIVVHGWGGSSMDNWLPWFKNEIEKLGHEVLVPDMPNTDNPVIEKWVNYLSEIVMVPDQNTYFVGHSIGCQTILRYLETISTPIGGALFVAGWFNLENLETEEEKEIAKPWINTKIDIVKIKKVLPKSTLLISDNDPYGALKENTQKFSEFTTNVVVLPEADHLTEEKEPVVLSQFLNLI